MITLVNIRTKKTKSYTDKKAKIILSNELIGGDYKIVGQTETAPTPPEAKIDLSKKKKQIEK